MEVLDMSVERLDRIEAKLDQLTEGMITLARAEEKLASLADDHDKGFERVNRLSSKLDDIESKVDQNAYTVSVINKLFWIAIGTFTAAIATQIWM